MVPMWFAHVGCRYGPRLPVFGVTTTFSVISWRVVSDGSVLRAFAGLLPLLTGNWALCGSVDDVFSSRGLYLPWRYRYLPLDHELVGRIPSGELAALPTAAWPKGSLGKITDTCSSEALILSLYRRHIECCLHTTG